MNNIEDFKYVLDIISLDLVIKKHLDAIREEEKRCKFLISKRDDKNAQLNLHIENHADLKKELSSLEKELFSLEGKISNTKKAINEISSNSQLITLESSLELFLNEKNNFEDTILNTLEQIEGIDSEINDCHTFISGVTETITEAQEELAIVKNENQTKIDQLENQILGLLSEIKNSIKPTFLKTREQFRFEFPVVKLQGMHCSVCRFSLSRSDADDIEVRNNFKICDGCGRLLIASHNF